ncbi:MAG: rhomboid family intramembrane serine protease [Chitinophagaceae bacterium]|nr:rhomboid family intramembrane serine protease [Chitinophagaceae bacterium]
MSFTLITVIITVAISIAAFNNESLVNKLILWPRYMHDPQEYYRLLTSGFIHADWNHLIFNMVSLYFIGSSAESILGMGFLTLYLTGIIISSLPSFLKHRNNSYYRSLGASGGVAAIMFFFIYFAPWSKLYIIFLPIGIPAILFGVLYLVYEAYMAKKGGGTMNHDAHFWGAVYGLVYALIIDPTHGKLFINAVLNP